MNYPNTSGVPAGTVPATPWVFPLGGLRIAASVLISFVALVGLGMSWSYWNTYFVVRDYLDGVPGLTDADLHAADGVSLVIVLGYLALLAAAAVVFLVWLWRARRNAEVLCAAPHRRSRGWVIGSWFCPIVNLWFPHSVVADVWKASNPAAPANQIDLTPLSRGWLVTPWWLLFLGGGIADQYSDRLVRDEITPELLRQSAIANTVGSVAWVGAAVLIIMIVRQVTRWQAAPRPPVPVDPYAGGPAPLPVHEGAPPVAPTTTGATAPEPPSSHP